MYKKFINSYNKNKSYYLSLSILTVLGIFLRLYNINNQFFVNDEWHKLTAASRYNFLHLFTHFSPYAPPSNIYAELLLNTIGWNEILLRLPSILAGIIALLIFPFLIQKVTNKRIALCFAALFSISQYAINYSRHSRPYSIILFLTFCFLFYILLFIKEGDEKYILIAAFFGFLSIYFHLFSLPIIFIGFIYILGLDVFKKFSFFTYLFNGEKYFINRKGLYKGLLLFFILMLIFFYFPVKNGLFDSLPHSSSMNLKLTTLWDISHYLCGTGYVYINILLLLLFFLGIYVHFKEDRILCILFFSTMIGVILSIIIAKPSQVNIPYVFMRYSIVLVPIFIFFTSCGINYLYHKLKLITEHKYRIRGILPVFTAGLFLFYFGHTPDIRLLKKPNNFTLHPVYQHNFYPFDMQYLASNYFGGCEKKMDKDSIPQFYKDIAKDTSIKRIIEFPMPIHTQINFYYFYQYYHQKEIIGGFLPGLSLPPFEYTRANSSKKKRSPRLEYYILGAKKDKLKFKNLCNIAEINSIKAADADFLIIHKNYCAESALMADVPILKFESILFNSYSKSIGPPYYEDKWIWVFKLK